MTVMADKVYQGQDQTRRRRFLKWAGVSAFVFLAGCETVVPRGAEPPPYAADALRCAVSKRAPIDVGGSFLPAD